MRSTRLRVVLLVGASAFGIPGWYWFRPERAFIDVRVADAAPQSLSTVLSQGTFVPGAHAGEGAATIVRLPNGRRIVRFTSFRTLNGPDVRVYLLGAPRVNGDDELRAAGHLDLGPLKGNVGDQNYVVPDEADLSRYRAVSVWCRRFGVNFTTAVLDREPPPPGG